MNPVIGKISTINIYHNDHSIAKLVPNVTVNWQGLDNDRHSCYDLHDSRQLHRAKMSVSLISGNSVQSVMGDRFESSDIDRFKPNLVIECNHDEPFAEDRWIGKQLLIGERVRLIGTWLKCNGSDINRHPVTGRTDPSTLHKLANRCYLLGIYASVAKPGEIHTGDIIRLV
jgi:MOSC domain